MTMIKDILKAKGRGYVSVSPNETVCAGLEKMAERNNWVGARYGWGGPRWHLHPSVIMRGTLGLKGRSSPLTLVKDAMSTQVACSDPNDTVDECMALMTMRCVRHLPVVDDEAVVGIISIGDLVKRIIDDQRFTIDQLETYIRGELYVH